MLDQNQIMEAKELYEKLSSFYQEKVELEAQKVEMAIRLQEELASVLDLRNKDGEVDVKAVKLPIVIAVVEAMRKSKENKYKLDAILASDIEKALENGELDTAFKAYDGVLNELDENKTNIKEAFKETSLLEKETLDAIALMAKDKYKEFKLDKKAEQGEKIKEPKDDTEIRNLIDELQDAFAEISEEDK